MAAAPGPRCVYCDAPIRKRTSHVWLYARGGAPAWPHEFSRVVEVDELPKTWVECQALTNGTVMSVRRTSNGRAIDCFTEWNGTAYVDKFFCNGSHARAFAYACANGGIKVNDLSNLSRRRSPDR